MAKLAPTRFTEYEFTGEEMYAATRLSLLTLQLLQTLAAKAAQQKVALTFDPTQPHSFIQQEACLTGQIEAYENLMGLVETTTVPEKPGSKPTETPAT